MKVLKVDLVSYLKKWAGKKTAKEISIDLDIHINTVWRYATKEGIDLEMPEWLEKKNLVESLIIEHHKQKPIYEIAKLAGVSYAFVQHKALRMGLKCFNSKVVSAPKTEIMKGEFFQEWEHEDWLIGPPRSAHTCRIIEKLTLSQSQRLLGSTPDRTQSRPNGRGLYLKSNK